MSINHKLKKPFRKNYSVISLCFCKEYHCSNNRCLQFDFKECSGDNIPVYTKLSCNDYFGGDKEVDAINNTGQIFDFLNVASFFSLFNENQNESLYFIKATVKDIAQKDLTFKIEVHQ